MGNITNRVAGFTTSLQGIYERSLPPEILINNLLGAIVFGVGAGASNTDHLLEFQNQDSVLQGYIRGDGVASFTDLFVENAFISGDLSVSNIEAESLKFNPLSSNPGNDFTLWVNSDDDLLYFGNSPIGMGFGDFFLSGIEDCDIFNNEYVITHDETTEAPTASLIIPQGDAALYMMGIYNVTSTSFTVVLSETPTISGYQIAWYRALGTS